MNKWEEYKKITDEVTETFFDLYCRDNWKQARKQIVTHDLKKAVHTCEHYSLIYKEDPKLQIVFYWVYCPKCSHTRRKYVIAWNSLDGVAYENELLRPNEKVREF